MAFIQQNGIYNGIELPLYWRLISQKSNIITRQEHVLDQAGNKIDINNAPVLLDNLGNRVDSYGIITDPGNANTQYLYKFVQYEEWNITFYAFLNKDESNSQKQYGIIKKNGESINIINRGDYIVKFEEQYGNELIGNNIRKHLYSHPSILKNIPEDWISDDV